MDTDPILETEEQLEEFMTRPSPALVADMARLRGDLLVLGVAGKMGPTLARMARRALDAAGSRARVYGAARFSDPSVKEKLAAAGVEPIVCDLLDRSAVARLPEASDVVFMAGRKFGSSGGEALTWAMNAYLPAITAERFPKARIAALSTGNVYSFVTPESGGSKETDPPGPVGEYAQSCLGRERIFEHFSRRNGTPVCLVRLSYAIDLRYGVLLDIARKVHAGQPVDARMGRVNVVWQGDANEVVLRSLGIASSPPTVINLTGPEKPAIREIAEEFGRLFGRPAVVAGVEEPTSLLSNTEALTARFGPGSVGLPLMMRLVARWVERGGPTLDKPTHFEERNGRF